MSDDAWAPPESDFAAASAAPSPDDASWSPPESDFQSAQNQSSTKETASQSGNGIGDTLGYYGRALAKGAINTVTGFPLMAADAGVAARNVFGKYTGIGGTDYELPSSMYRRQLNQTFGEPQTTAEKVNDVVLPMIMGAGAASSEAPAALRQLIGVPEAAEQAPANFVSPADAQKQILAQTIREHLRAGPPRPVGAHNLRRLQFVGRIEFEAQQPALDRAIKDGVHAVCVDADLLPKRRVPGQHRGLPALEPFAQRDADGYITFVGRADDVFKASDYRISPFELESALIEHEAVIEVAVVPSPDPVRLAVPKAYLILAAGRHPDAALAEEIFAFSRQQLAPYKRVRRIEFVNELPKTISGKIRRVQLRGGEVGRRNTDQRGEHEFFEEDFPSLRG